MSLEISLRRATSGDADRIQKVLYPEYFEESAYRNLTYSEENTRICVNRWVNEAITVVCESGEIIGFFCLSVHKTYYEENEADIEMFYVRKKYRNTGAGRLMAEAAVNLAKLHKARTMFALCASGIEEKNDQLWKNLFSKFGFKKLGTCMYGQWIN